MPYSTATPSAGAAVANNHTSNQLEEYGYDELIVNYKDACIYGRDLQLFEAADGWLNDACIHYAFQRIAADMATNSNQTQVGSNHDKASVLLMDPAVLSFFMHCNGDKDDVADFCNGFQQFDGMQRFFFAVNDRMTGAEQIVGQQGSHWSLLVGSTVLVDGDDKKTSTLVFYHFDSVCGSNGGCAQQIAQAFWHAWTSCRDDSNSSSASSTSLAVAFNECSVPQQLNGYDCGIHVLAMAEALLPPLGRLADGGDSPCTTAARLKSAYENRIRQFFSDKNNRSIGLSYRDLRRRWARDVRETTRATRDTVSTR